MNILLITSDLNVLREQSPARLEMEKYATLAKHVVVIVLNTRRDRYALVKASESLLILPANAYAPIFLPLAALRLAKRELYFQGKLQTDVIMGQDLGIAGFVARFLSNRFKVPLLLRITRDILSRGYASQSYAHSMRTKLASFLVRRAQGLIISTEGIRASLADISTAIADRAMIAPHFMDIDALSMEPIHVDLLAKYPQFKVIMLAVAPLEKPYNVQLAITILAGVVRLFPHIGLVIVGNGSLSGKLRSYARKIGMEAHVAFETSTENISSYLKSSRIFLVTAPYEEYADTIEQAAAASCAIVTTKVGIAPAIIEDGVTGFLCEPEDAPRFVASVILMLRKPSTCDSIRLNGHLAIEKYMDSDEATYLKFIKEAWDKTVSISAQLSL
jgi:glycosyltransferase involved in cell wall biosynthesis